MEIRAKISKEIKELVLWKLELELPKNFKLSIGNKGTFSKTDLKREVENESEVGVMFAEMQLQFMRDLVNGKISKVLAECQC